MAKKLTKYLLYSLILSLGFGQLMRFNFFDTTFYLHDVFVLSIILLNLNLIPKVKLGVGLKLFILGIIISWLYAILHFGLNSLLVPFLYTARLFSYILLYLILSISIKKIPFQLFFLSGTISLLIGIAQYLFMPDQRIFQYLGWDDHLSRLTFPHYDPSFSGIMLGIYLLIFLTIKGVNAGLFLYVLGIFLTYARSVWISLILTAMLFLKSPKLRFIVIILALLGIILLPRSFGEGTNLLRTFSITSRLNSDLNLFTNNFFSLIVGRGYNTLILDNPSSIFPNHATGPNNSYLLLLITTGVIGLFGFSLFIYEQFIKSKFRAVFSFVLLASLFNNALLYPFVFLLLLLSNLIMVPSEA